MRRSSCAPPTAVAAAAAAVALLSCAGCTMLPKLDFDRATLDDVTRVCALLVSCPLPSGDRAPGFATDCVRAGQEIIAGAAARFDSFGPMSKRQLACAVTARDCAALEACLTDGHDRGWCAAHRALACDGDAIIDCGARLSPAFLKGLPVAIDCAAQGLTCLDVADRAVCTSGVSCPAHREVCDGPFLRACEDGVETIVTDCRPVFGEDSVCVFAKGEFNCTFETCADRGSCEGPTAVICDEGNRIRVDCARAWDGRCERTDGGGVACVPDGRECRDGDPPRCAGPALELCAAGRYRAVDCAALGFRGCVANRCANR